MKTRTSLFIAAVLLGTYVSAYGGGPLVSGSAGFGRDGQPFTWDVASMPIQYRVDSGPMAKIPAGAATIDNAAGLTRLQNMLTLWQSVPTASISFQYAGAIKPAGSFAGVDVATVADFNAVYGSCKAAEQNPIVFDADGSIVRDLGLPPDIIGFAAPCKLDSTTGHIVSGYAVLNGGFQDGVSLGTNFELTAAQFDEAITHELGHFLGLDHSQINDDVLDGQLPCSPNKLAGLPLMFPFAYCQARADAGLPILSPDDKAWISNLYPNDAFLANYGIIKGVIFFSDGRTPVQGVNVIARRVDDPATVEDESLRIAVSAVSGYLFTASLGQTVTGDNDQGSLSGSRNPGLVGYYEIPVPPGNYTVEVNSIRPYFEAGSGVGPLNPPIRSPGQPEFWDKNESAFDVAGVSDAITVHAGETVKDINVILNGTPTRFDQFEDGILGLLWLHGIPLLDGREGEA
jgi:hypothetical protein